MAMIGIGYEFKRDGGGLGIERGIDPGKGLRELFPRCMVFPPSIRVSCHTALFHHPPSLSRCPPILPGILLLQASRGIPFTSGPGASLCAGDINSEACVISAERRALDQALSAGPALFLWACAVVWGTKKATG